MQTFRLFRLIFPAALILIAIVPFASPAWADTQESPPDDSQKGSVIERAVPIIDNSQKELSKKVTSTAEWLDSFFLDEAYEVEKNTTRLWIRMDAFQESGESTEFNFRPVLKLVLPYTQDRLHLEIFSSADEDMDVYDENPPLENRQLTQLTKVPTTAALRYFIKTKDRLNLSLVGGAFIDDNIPHFYLGPRSRISYKYRSVDIAFIEWLRLITDGNVESESRIDFDYKLNEPLLFRTRLEGDWSDEEDEFLQSISFLLYQQLSSHRALGYEWNNLFTNRPGERMEEINFRLKYRQKIWRDWMYVEVAPQLSFPRDRDFRQTPGILFRVEFFFGPED